jgi:F-type H+-transporting ATPase subunit epsilon
MTKAPKLTFSLSTPASTVFEGPVQSVLLKALDGQLEVFPGHMPLLGILQAGIVRVRMNDSQDPFVYYNTGDGIIHVTPETVHVFAESASLNEDAVIEEAPATYAW